MATYINLLNIRIFTRIGFTTLSFFPKHVIDLEPLVANVTQHTEICNFHHMSISVY